MKNIQNITTAYTHASVFHSDDVFAAAFLRMLNPEIKIERVNKVLPEMEAEDTIVFDIGGGEYDHHQADRTLRYMADGYYFDKEGRMSAIPYCAFGLLWRDYGYLLCASAKAWSKVDKTLVISIDKADNGVAGNTLSSVISDMNPFWDENQSEASRFGRFLQAVTFATSVLERAIAKANSEARAEDLVLNSKVVDGNILVLDQYLPWADVVIEQMPDILYVVFPSARGGYNVQTVPDAPGSFNGRKLFPTEWLGHPLTEEGMTFCHVGNFLLATETLDQAIHFARVAAAR